MILADENIHSSIILTLREAGFHVVSVSENFKSIKDEQVIRMALENDYLLLTEDEDFGEWIFAHHVKDLSVLFLRYLNVEKNKKREIQNLLKFRFNQLYFHAAILCLLD